MNSPDGSKKIAYNKTVRAADQASFDVTGFWSQDMPKKEHDNPMNTSNSPPTGRATTVKRFFSRQTSVEIDIAASPEQIWKLLTNANSFPAWNSTIVELTGTIALGEKIVLRSTLAPDRKFKLKVKEFEPNKRLVWGDAMGTRIFTLSPQSNGETRFSMSETIGGPLFPLFSRMIPPFDDSFNQFAADLKKAAEEST